MRLCYGLQPDGTRAPGTLSRRDFLARAAAVAVAASTASALAGDSTAHAMNTASALASSRPARRGRVPLSQISIQLFTMSDQTSSDMAGTLQELGKIGYRRVEHAGRGDRTAAEFRKMLDDAGLVCSSSHTNVPFPYDDANWRQECEDAATIGQCYIGPGSALFALPSHLGGPGINSVMWGAYIDALNQAGAVAQEYGLHVLYHNHTGEYVPFSDDPSRLPIEMMIAETDPRFVHMEMDLAWVTAAGQDPVKWLRKYPDRYWQLHIKDVDAEGNVADPGKGIVNFKRILRVGESVGIKEHIVERDGAGDRAFEIAEMGFKLLRDLRWRPRR